MTSPAEKTGPKTASDTPFLTDVSELRRRARKHIEDGAVTSGYAANKEVVLKILNEALATEIVRDRQDGLSFR